MTATPGNPTGGIRVLLVEDKPDRTAFFGQLYQSQTFAAVTTGEEAVELVREGLFGLVHLDFGLAGELTGADVAEAIAQQNSPPRVLVHSENLTGVMAIQQVLPAAAYVPFSHLRNAGAHKSLEGVPGATGPSARDRHRGGDSVRHGGGVGSGVKRAWGQTRTSAAHAMKHNNGGLECQETCHGSPGLPVSTSLRTNSVRWDT
jgi:CheY-like chemotaxis protein